MPPVAAAVGAIAGGIASAGGAALSLAGSALGGLATAGGSALGGLATAGGSALGGLAAAGGSAVSGIGGLFSPGYGVKGGLIGPATQGQAAWQAAGGLVGIAKTGAGIYGMFQRPDSPTGQQPTKQPTQYKSIPTNILNTLPNIIRQPQQQIMTTPAPTPKQAPENTLVKYVPWIAAAALAYFVLGK